MDVYFSNHNLYLFHVVFARDNCRMVVYGYKPDTFVAVYPALQGTDAPRVPHLQKTLRSIRLIGSPKTTVII